MTIYGYARVSTKSQSSEGNSLKAQETVLKENGATVIYKDSFTGTKINRPEFEKLLSALKKEDTLMVTKLDRFARSMSQGSELVNDLIARGVKVNILNIGVMDNTPSSKLIRNVFFAFAEFERDMIIDRTAEGKEIARQKVGYKEGRPEKYSKKQIEMALEMLRNHSYAEVTESTGISKSTLIRAKRGQSYKVNRIENLD